jgi:nucleoside-diphosphate-sugar epimerase
MTKRIVVLGASGFIGRRVVKAIAASAEFHAVAVSRRAIAALSGPGVEAINADASSAADLRPVISNADAIINCIAGPPEVIVSSTLALLDAVRTMPSAPRLVHLSSLAAYGTATGTIDETAPLRGDLDEYSAAKAHTDRLVSELQAAVVLRPGIVFGPGSPWWSDRIARLLTKGRLGNLGRTGEGACNLVYVDDVAQACVLALAPLSTPCAFNLSIREPLTWNEYFARYARALSVSAAVIPRWQLALETRVLSVPLKGLELLLANTGRAERNPWPPLRPWLPALCARQLRLDVARAEHTLQLQWTPLDAALEVTAKWFLSGGRTAG